MASNQTPTEYRSCSIVASLARQKGGGSKRGEAVLVSVALTFHNTGLMPLTPPFATPKRNLCRRGTASRKCARVNLIHPPSAALTIFPADLEHVREILRRHFWSRAKSYSTCVAASIDTACICEPERRKSIKNHGGPRAAKLPLKTFYWPRCQ